MKLHIMLLTALLAFGNAAARQSSESSEVSMVEAADILNDNLIEMADGVAMVRYTVTVYKDRTEHGHDEAAWEDVVRSTGDSMRALDKGVGFAQAIERMINVARSQGDDNGIHGDISVSMSDGEPSDCCGENCRCGDRFKGNCPCALDGTSCADRAGEGCCK